MPYNIILLCMAYNNKGHLRRVAQVVEIYNQVKEHDVPDSKIVKHIFPKHGIFISYRTWMIWKNLPISKLKAAN